MPPYGKYCFGSFGYNHVGPTPRSEPNNIHKLSPTKFGTGRFPSTPGGVRAENEASLPWGPPPHSDPRRWPQAREQAELAKKQAAQQRGKKPNFANSTTVHHGEGWQPKARREPPKTDLQEGNVKTLALAPRHNRRALRIPE